ncbi:exocyst complex component EXO70A1-like [Olea europaea var. sylvestris]|uniref:exocyst complex component EXO70A1-like n=1 Tax=Olea europaea var. sylvestris TaxID=158386 RepID=UPI000C1D116B|nr:exocyst complex component EXO70A1-like [Olea europaea var. sylvestris]
MEGIENLVSARNLLKGSLEKSRDIAFELNKISPRLEKSNQRLSFLENSMKDMACKCRLYEIRSHVDSAIGPAAGVLRILDVVYELEDSLVADPDSDLFAYIATVKRLEDALKLLTDNSELVILWLEDLVQFLKNIEVSDDHWYLINMSKALDILWELHSMGQNGKVLLAALENLENEYRHILTEYSFPFPLCSLLPSPKGKASILPVSLPLPVVEKLQAITEKLASNNRLENCVSIYAQVRSSNVRASLQALDVDYLHIQLSEFDSAQTAESYMDLWDKHLEFAVKHLLDKEYHLCSEVFGKAGSDVWMHCFAKLAIQSGINDFIKFGDTITKCKKDAIKLLKLLKIFATLNKLRLDFNRLFSGKFCVKIQTQTRDLVKKVVTGVCEIFWELCIQVELQRQSSPPPDGSVPRPVCFVTGYCNQLLEDENRSVLIQVLEIYQVWNHESCEEEVLFNEIHSVMRELELNLESWAKAYKETALSCLFMMNSYWFFFNNIKGTKLGDLMGDSWLRGNEEYFEYYATLHMRESWEKLPVLLQEEGLILFPGGRAIDRELAKKRINSFNEAIDDMYKKQSNWILSDKGLRLRICQLAVQTVVPPYKNYLQKCAYGIENEVGTGGDFKYTAESLEYLINSFFQQKVGKFDGTKCTDLIRIKNAVINHFSLPAAA